MAALWRCGFELNTATSNVEVDSTTAALSIVTTPSPHTGTYCGKDAPSSNGPAFKHNIYASNSARKVWIRAYLQFTSLPGAIKNMIALENSGSSAGAIIRTNASNQLTLFNVQSSSTVGSPSSTLTANVWHRLDLFVDGISAGGSATIEARLDGTVFATTSAATVGSVQIATFGDFTGYTAYWDDIGINDDTLSSQNGYLPDGDLAYYRPSGPGNNTQWSIGGGSPAATNWQSVNAITPNDGTTMVQSHTSGQIDDYTVTIQSGSVPAGSTINAILVGMRYAGDSASANASFVTRIKTVSAGTVNESSAITPSNATYYTNAGAIPFNYPNVIYTEPGGSNPITTTDLANMQIGVRCSTSNTNNVDLTDIWAIVDYSAGAAPPSTTGGTYTLLGIG